LSVAEPAGNRASSIGRRRALARREQNASWIERRNEILTAAADAFRAKGYQAVSMSDIAHRLGGDRASVYYYFASKQEIFHGLVEQAVRSNVELVEATAVADDTATARLDTLIQSLAESYEQHYPYLHLYVQEDMRRLSDSDSTDDQHLRELGNRYDAAVMRIIRDGVASGEIRADLDPDMVRFVVMGALNWTHRWFVPGGRMTGTEIGRAFSDILLRGVLAAPQN
jgi:AcrR family transcriptional regulator